MARVPLATRGSSAHEWNHYTMRERNLLSLFLILNVALAAAFISYLFLSSSNGPSLGSVGFASVATVKTKAATNAATNVLPAAAGPTRKVPAPAQPRPLDKNPSSEQPDRAMSKGVFTHRKFTWEDVGSSEYPAYLESLRAVGCPEDRVRSIIVADVNECFARHKLKLALQQDHQYWRAPLDPAMAGLYREKGRELEDERYDLLRRHLGPKLAEAERGERLAWSGVPLTGSVLGSLSPQAHNAVQEIWARSLEKYESAYWARVNAGQPLNQVELARLREQTRAELVRVLNAPQLEEFVLRYSHSAGELRDELRGFQPSAEEFRGVFRAVAPIDHQMQIEYGTAAALSPKQKERWAQQREGAIQEALTPERYQDYLVLKDPVYRRAQQTALQYNAPAATIMPIYQMTKASESKRLKIINDLGLTPEQRSDALNAVNQEHQKSLQQLVGGASATR